MTIYQKSGLVSRLSENTEPIWFENLKEKFYHFSKFNVNSL